MIPMRKQTIVTCLLLSSLTFPCFGQQKIHAVRTGGEKHGSSELFLSDDDIAHIKRIMPSLAEASQRGPKETASYLATLDISFDRITQILSNVYVAYSVIKFEEWSKKIKPLLTADKTSPYRQSLQKGQHQLDQITAKYRAASDGGKTALDANEEVVRKKLTDVESVLVRMQTANPSSMPFHPINASEVKP
jgi:hypothetical protein